MIDLLDEYVIEISESQKNTILRAALQAPTGDNAQCWDVSFEETILKIEHDKQRANHILNDNCLASLLSLGTVVESINIAALELGFSTIVQYSLDDKNLALWATIIFKNTNNASEEDLNEALYKRETNRNNYKRKRIPSELLDKLKSFAKDLNIKISEKYPLSRDMFWYLHLCEHYIWYNREVFMDTTYWIRFSQKQRLELRDGFGLKNIKLKSFEGLLVKLFRKSEFCAKLAWVFILRFKIWIDSFLVLRNTGSFLIFSAKASEDIDVVNTGRTMFRAWTSLNKIGYGVQPLTVASLLPFNLAKSGKLRDCPQNFHDEFTKSRGYFKQCFSLEDNDKVIWMLRTGPAKPLSCLLYTSPSPRD